MSNDIEVCMVSYNSIDALTRSVECALDAIPGVRISIREHGSDERSARLLREFVDKRSDRVRLSFDATNPGFGAGCNSLAVESTARWLLFLNPDADISTWPWTAHSTPPRGQIVGPVLEGNGSPRRHVGETYGVFDEIGRSWFRRLGRFPDGIGFVSGAALLVERIAFDAIGGFDEGYFMFYEDIDLCLRANSVHIATTVEHRWRVHHAGGHATSSRFGDALIWSYQSACRFHARNGGNLGIYRFYVIADALLRRSWHRMCMRRSAASAYRSLANVAWTDLRRSSRSRRP